VQADNDAAKNNATENATRLSMGRARPAGAKFRHVQRCQPFDAKRREQFSIVGDNNLLDAVAATLDCPVTQ
jgi:hypothetical protein